MTGLKIRVGLPADGAEVVALWTAAGLVRPGADPAAEVAFAATHANAVLLVGEIDGRIVGTVLAGHDGHRGWLYRAAVTEDLRGRGHGRALVLEAEAWLARQDVPKAMLLIREPNAGLRDFYAHLGYAAQPRLVMAKPLNDKREPAPERIDVVVTYMEMTAPSTRPTIPTPAGKLALLRAENPPLGFYRYLYNTVGEPWFWIDRRKLDDAVLSAIIGDPKVEIYVLYVGGVPAGFAELDRRPAPDINLALFGLVPQFTGRGLGPYFLNWAVDAAWQHRPQRLTVDTCTLDHPKSFGMYQRAGFVPYKQATKTIGDPRRAGLIPAHRQPRLP